MAWVFVRLKLRILRSRLAKSSLMGLIGFVALWLVALGIGPMMGGLFAAALGYFEGLTLRVLVTVFNIVGVIWLVVPVIAASLDDSLDPRRFELLPLPLRTFVTGLLLAALIGPGSLATVLVFGFGLGFGLATPFTLVLMFGVAVMATAAMVATARALTTWLSDLLRRRRAQEVVALTLGLFLAFPGLLSIAITEGRLTADDGADVAGILDVLVWTPFGAFGAMAWAIHDGRWPAMIAWSLYALGFLALMLWAFARGLDRLQTRTAESGPKAVTTETSLMPSRLPLPAGAIGGVAAKELRYLRRDVRVRSQLLGGAIAVVVISVTGGLALLDTPYAPFLAAAAVFIVVASVIPNQFGFDGGSFWGYMTTVGRIGDVIRGKNLGWGIVSVPIAVFVAVVAAIASGRWGYVPAALAGTGAVLLVWMAVGNISSIFGGFRLPESNMFGNRNMSGTAFVYSFLGIFVSGLLTLPVVAAVGISAWRWGTGAATLGALVGLCYAIVLYRIGLAWADRAIEHRSQQLLETIDKEL